MPFLLSAVLVGMVAVRAQEDHSKHQHAVAGLGTVNFPISCNAEAQTRFTRAVALLHSFGYEESAQAFGRVAAADPSCGMAHWGRAMTYFHPIWTPPSANELKKGAEASALATKVSAKTERERDYIAALAVFYRDTDKTPHGPRAIAYREAMRKLHEKYPQDDEAAIFYALIVRGTADDNDKTYAQQKQAATILNEVLPRNQNHPGVAHYLIHSFDYPPLAELALPAARAYAKIAPDAPHALHMPSHIFTRLGLWDESVESNLASAASAKKRTATMHPGAGAFDELHADDYLVYAWLQQAKDDRARRILDEMRAMTRLDENQFAAAYAFAASPARYALERRDWKAAAALQVEPAWFPWAAFPFAEATIHFARALGSARTGELTGAEAEISKLAALKKVAPKQPYDWATQVEIQELAARAWLTLAKGDPAEARRIANSAADLEDRTEKNPVTPGSVLPARELLGDMLMETGSPAEALVAYRAALRISPGRFRSIEGAARAAKLAGDAAAARGYYAELLALCKQATEPRPELEQARTFLAVNEHD